MSDILHSLAPLEDSDISIIGDNKKNKTVAIIEQ